MNSSSKCLCLALLAGLPLWTGADTASSNLLKNPSFETAGDQPDVAANWFRWGDWINREDSWSPVHSGKALIGYHHWQIEKADDSGLWQDVDVTPGKSYEFSVFATHDDPKDGHDADNIEVRLEGVAGDKSTKIDGKSMKVSDLATDKAWTKVSVSGKATTSKLRVLIVVKPAADTPRAGSVKIDDAMLTAK